ncbi:DUF4209 domain-containing protein [Methanocalculus sp. MC3]|jgi:hypothetical protein
MHSERYPTDLIVTVDDFRACGWQDVLSAASQKNYSTMWTTFSDAAKRAIESGNQSHGKVLWLLADACSMMLSPSSFNEPFKPFYVINGQRSVIPDDFSKDDITFFANIVELIGDPWLKSRLSDLVWLKQRPRKFQFALHAIDSYRSISLDQETWLDGGCDCWDRAIKLALSLNKGAGSRLKEMEELIIQTFEEAPKASGYFSLWLADLLLNNKLAYAHAPSIASKLEQMASSFDCIGDFRKARDFYDASAKWFKIADNDDMWVQMTISLAECFAKEAEAILSSDQPKAIIANINYGDAIKIYRTIPGSFREKYKVDERIAEIYVLFKQSGEESVNELRKISSSPIDISLDIKKACDAVRGKDYSEAIRIFANLQPYVSKKGIRENALNIIKNNPLHAHFPATVMSSDGRVIARRPGFSFGDALSEDDERVIQVGMIEYYNIQIDYTVKANILPAQNILLCEHRLREVDFIALAKISPIVPEGREQLFGKALFAGYDRDYMTALHLIVPQIENVVRHHLKIAGVKTTTLDSNGIETEIGLSKLMEIPEVETLFGEDLSFELKSLFCDPYGQNLRNGVAHGLLDDTKCRSTYAIYAWWFGLKLVINTLWNAIQRLNKEEAEVQP